MKKLTPAEVRDHNDTIKKIRGRATRARTRFHNCDITYKKLLVIEKEVKAKEVEYIKKSGVILYYGQLFKVVA